MKGKSKPAGLSEFPRSVPIPPECTLWELIEERTGKVLSPEHFEAWQRTRERERRQKITVMRALGKGGRISRDSAKDSITVVGLMTAHSETIIKTPRWNCFSWVARAHRREFLRNLTFYLSHRSNCRHIRVTIGPRVGLSEIGSRMQALAKAISRLNTRPWFKEHLEVVSRSCELTWDGATAHVHAHVVVRPLGDLSEDDCISLQGQVQDHCGGDTDDFVLVGDAAKAAPYFAKSDDLQGMAGDEIRIYADQLRHVRSHEALGEFRAFCAELKHTNTKLVKRGRYIVRVNRSDGLRRRWTKRGPARVANGAPSANQVVRLGQPRPHGSNALEPALYVRDYDGNFEALLDKNPSLAKIREKLMPQWPGDPRSAPGAIPNVPCTVQVSDQPQSRTRSTSTSPSASPSPHSNAIPVTSPSATAPLRPRPTPPASSSAVKTKAPLTQCVSTSSHPTTTHRPTPSTNCDGDVAPAPLAPASPFLRSELDRYRHFLDEDPEPQRKRSRSVPKPGSPAEP